LGVEICTNERVDNPLELLEEGYSAIILAMGCQAPVKLDIEGHENLTDCLEFLRNVSDGKLAKLPGKTIVIGGGNAALDSARTALRLGGETIIAYRRTEEQMPAEAEEIHHAKEEGINFQFLAIPHRVLTHGKKITGMEFQRAELGEPDDSGRCSPVPIPDDYFTIEADNVILALGSNTDTSSLPDTLKLTKWSTLETDEWNMTSQQGLFAAGDIVSGPSTIVDAIGSGHCAANGVMNFLIGEEGDFGARTSEMMLIVESEVPDAEKRVEAVCIPANKRQTTFDEVEMGLEEANALAEANRCRRCGSCSVCSVCLSVCDYRNAVITILDADESALAKIPFQLAEKGMGQDWKIQIDNEEFAVKIEPIMARVDETLCIACGRCEESCPYKAIRT
ncbi:MAG: FAD-dependent oxidoreductase, partial [Thermoplasmata archaeon]|nr:FAD-dependent oxidoreductase [Thermoplasmata archaeon]